MKQLTEEQQMEVYVLSFKINYWLLWCGIFIGNAVNLFGLTLLLGRVTMLTLLGVGFLGAALGSYQYRNHLKDKLNGLIQELKQ